MTISRRFFLTSAGAASSVAAMAIPAASVVAADVPVLAPAAAKSANNWKWWVSFDSGEVYNEDFPTKEAAEKYAANSGAGLVAECLQQDYDLRINGDQLFEMLQDFNEELIGEGEFIDATKEQLSELENAVNGAIAAWADKHNLHKTAWVFGDVRNKTEVAASPDAKERERLMNERWEGYRKTHSA